VDSLVSSFFFVHCAHSPRASGNFPKRRSQHTRALKIVRGLPFPVLTGEMDLRRVRGFSHMNGRDILPTQTG
jgi:hypothetical protein